MSYPALRALEEGVEPIVVVFANDSGYCVTNTGSRELWYESNRSGLTQAPCSEYLRAPNPDGAGGCVVTTCVCRCWIRGAVENFRRCCKGQSARQRHPG